MFCILLYRKLDGLFFICNHQSILMYFVLRMTSVTFVVQVITIQCFYPALFDQKSRGKGNGNRIARREYNTSCFYLKKKRYEISMDVTYNLVNNPTLFHRTHLLEMPRMSNP